jgi:hypothetical protein
MFQKMTESLPNRVPSPSMKTFREGFLERGGECHRHDSTACCRAGFQKGFLQRCQDTYRHDAGTVEDDPVIAHHLYIADTERGVMKRSGQDAGNVSGRVSHVIEQVPVGINLRPLGPLGTVRHRLPTRHNSSDGWDKSNTGCPRGTGRGREESPPSIRCESVGQLREPTCRRDADRHRSIAARGAHRDRHIRR